MLYNTQTKYSAANNGQYLTEKNTTVIGNVGSIAVALIAFIILCYHFMFPLDGNIMILFHLLKGFLAGSTTEPGIVSSAS